MNNKKTCYIKTDIDRYDITVHVWISIPLTDVECKVLELLIKGYNVTQISKYRLRSIKTISIQKNQIYNKLDIRNDFTFWIDLSLSPYVKIKFFCNDKIHKSCILPCHHDILMN
ncbi:TPA: helix-turn-helix domain-containing protein [Escherichia albertii]|nr:helix-turn-helix domain-containing protein [Escherichia albertii]EEX2837029.1 helix-turn-helix domain-containing protein [Escherichia albertii]EJM9606332.1 helix-turn-helix domain-containing protein [Escherichia albertii]EJS1738442.1 helix-turn-helix domain-containing protein [Escherichia albertii]